MTINLTAPQAPVTDEELDQMIWKLERDGMTPKMLSLMRELREVRKAKSEPVAVINGAREPVLYGENIGIAIGTHLYAAPPLPVPSNIPPEKPHTDGPLADGWNACRAAMLQAGNSPATPDGWIPVSERMPKDGDIVLVVDDGYFVCEAQYREGEFYSAVRGRDEFFETTCRDVKHWQPLPAAPKEAG